MPAPPARPRRAQLDVLLQLPPGGRPGRAIEAALREAIRDGRLAAGTPLPGSRTLAADLRTSRGTVVRAITQLVAEGWLETAPGSGTRVAEHAGRAPARADGGRAALDLRPGRPDLESFPDAAWRSALARALTSTPAARLGYDDVAGTPELRAAAAEYVARARGVDVTAAAVTITAGVTQALAVIAQALVRGGARRIAVEDPGLRRHRAVLADNGLAVVAVPVDGDGADPSALPDADAVLLTPAHQFPTGVPLHAARRAALVAWARRTDAYILEDDYDGDFRAYLPAEGAMQRLAPDRVVYLSSVSKALAPGVRLGWMVVPPALADAVARSHAAAGGPPSALEQLTLAELLAAGHYDRHVRRRRRAYEQRRAELAAVAPAHATGGLHTLVPVASPVAERQVIERAAAAGLLLGGLHVDRYWHEPARRGAAAALVVGFATPPGHAWRAARETLASALDQSPKPARQVG